MDELRRFVKPLTLDRLEDVLGGIRLPTEAMPAPIELDPVRNAVSNALTGFDPGQQSALDTALVEPLHRSLASLTHRGAADMRVWHWLCAVEFPELVWKRWNRTGAVPASEEIPATLTHAMGTRFMGGSSLNGVSRNSLARLWWTAETLREGEDYDLARLALARQDRFQAIFERFFGLRPVVAKACLRRLAEESEDNTRKATKWLQQAASTTVIEYLDEPAITTILEEALVS